MPFRWLHDAVTPGGPSLTACLQPTPRAHADDFSVGAPSFWTLMPAIDPVFRTLFNDTGMHLNCKKCSCIRDGNEACDSLHSLVVDNCLDFGEMKVARVAKCVGAMIGPDGYFIVGQRFVTSL